MGLTSGKNALNSNSRGWIRNGSDLEIFFYLTGKLWPTHGSYNWSWSTVWPSWLWPLRQCCEASSKATWWTQCETCGGLFHLDFSEHVGEAGCVLSVNSRRWRTATPGIAAVCGAKPGESDSSCQGILWIPLPANARCKSVMHFDGFSVDSAIMFREFQMFCRNRISRSSRNLYLKATMTVWVQGENGTLWTRDWLCWL